MVTLLASSIFYGLPCKLTPPVGDREMGLTANSLRRGAERALPFDGHVWKRDWTIDGVTDLLVWLLLAWRAVRVGVEVFCFSAWPIEQR